VKTEDIVKYALLAVAGYWVYTKIQDAGGLQPLLEGVTGQVVVPIPAQTQEQAAAIQVAIDQGHEVTGIHPEGGYVMVADRRVSSATREDLRMSRIGDPTGVTTRGSGDTVGRGGAGGGSMRGIPPYNSGPGGWS